MSSSFGSVTQRPCCCRPCETKLGEQLRAASCDGLVTLGVAVPVSLQRGVHEPFPLGASVGVFAARDLRW
jgi:hypothetical protein